MPQNDLEVRLTEKEAAHYFSNAAALYVLGVGFSVFALKAQGMFMAATCFWFSVFLLCDCFRLARVCRRLTENQNLLLKANGSGITHFTSWMWPEQLEWKDITGFRTVKTPQSETLYLQTKRKNVPFYRIAFFGSPKFDVPVACIKGGQEGFLHMLENFPEAKHLVPARASQEDLRQAA